MNFNRLLLFKGLTLSIERLGNACLPPVSALTVVSFKRFMRFLNTLAAQA